MTNVLRLAAFSQNGQGGNPAGVASYDEMPTAEKMLSVAKDVGYSETAFVVKQPAGWRVRYFAPESEVPFCGHATIALGAALGERFGEGTYRLQLNQDVISVCAEQSASGAIATGAAAAALAGYLRDIGWKGPKTFTILQGEEMGMPSRLTVSFTPTSGESIAG